VKALLEREEGHFSAEEIYLLVKDKAPEIGLATVYRKLEVLLELEDVDKINFGDGVCRYDLRKEDAEHFHHHLVCIECGSVEEIVDALLGEVKKIVESEWGFLVKDHRLTFHGLCRQYQQATIKST